MVLAATSTATIAQWYPDSDPRSSNYQQYLQQQREEFNKRQRDEEARNKAHAEEMYGQKPSSPSGGSSAGTGTDMRALGKELMRLPPLPVERNVLLGSWRLEGGGPRSGVAEFAITGRGATPGLGEMMGMLGDMQSGKMLCDMSFGRGITFTPTTFSSGGAAGIAEGPIAYRSRKKQVIVAIPGDSRANPMPFEIVGPNRIVSELGGCALVRVGTPAANAAANATTAPGNARTAAANSSAPPAAALPQVASAAPSVVGAVVDGAAFRCADGSLLHVSFCQGASAAATCKLAELHKPGLQIGALVRRADIAARVKGCEAGGIRYGADDKPVFVR